MLSSRLLISFLAFGLTPACGSGDDDDDDTAGDGDADSDADADADADADGDTDADADTDADGDGDVDPSCVPFCVYAASCDVPEDECFDFCGCFARTFRADLWAEFADCADGMDSCEGLNVEDGPCLEPLLDAEPTEIALEVMDACEARLAQDGECTFMHCENLFLYSDESLEGIRDCLDLPVCLSDDGGDVYECTHAYDCG